MDLPSFNYINLNLDKAKGSTETLNKPIDKPKEKNENTKTQNSQQSDQLFTDITEVTTDNSKGTNFYPDTQPFLAKVWIRFPQSFSATTTTTSGTGIDTSSTSNFSQSLGVGTTTSSTSFTPNYGSDELEIRPQNLISFDFQRMINGIGMFSITLFDPTWTTIEDKIIKNKGYISFRYGYVEGQKTEGSNLISNWYKGKIFNYKMKFQMEGVTLTISGLTFGFEFAIPKGFNVDGLKGQKISDIVKNIAGDNYETVIEPTSSVLSQDALDDSNLTEKNFNITGEDKFRYILETLQKYAKNENLQGGYNFFIKNPPTSDKKPELHFHTLYYKDNSDNSVTYGFTQFKEKNPALLSFEPNWQMSLVQIQGAGSTLSVATDFVTKRTEAKIINNDTIPQQSDGGGNIIKDDSTTYKVGEANKDNLSFFIHVKPSRTITENDAIVQANYSKRIRNAFTGRLVILGTPAFDLCQKIAVIVYVPQQDTMTANFKNTHYVSGYFRIIKIQDHISAGSFTTTMELTTTARKALEGEAMESS